MRRLAIPLRSLVLLAYSAFAHADEDYFAREVWPKVASKTCIKCHKAGGDAEDSDFILLEPARSGALVHNRDAFTRMAAVRKDDRSRMLLKVVGKLKHGGEDVLDPESTRYRILEAFVNGTPPPSRAEIPAGDFFHGVTMLDDRRLLRRLTLSLAARLPTREEMEAVTSGGPDAIQSVLDQLMTEPAFYDRLAEGFNDIFLTIGYDGVAENALSYEHFEKTRHWYQHRDFSNIADKKERQKAGWELARVYRESMLREPMELVKHIVRAERPFTEIITADYIMVSPHTARGYGVFEENRGRFEDPENPFEYVPVRLKALTGRSRSTNQESATGFYPHAGILSTFQYLMRFPTTETNRNRLRARMYFEQFLGIDILALAPRVNDAAAITSRYEIPTMQAADCVVCHKIIDPVAGLFQDYYVVDAKGVFGLRKEGWFEDMFAPGLDGEPLPDAERWRALQWLGERTAKDPRFANAMVGHVWYILTGRKPLLPPEDIGHPLYSARQRAYRQQHDEIEAIARRFSENGFNLKSVFKELAASPFYRTDGLTTKDVDPARQAELDDLGLVRILSPEQLERKLKAIFGKGWGRLDDPEQFLILYGGIDSKEITERIADPSGAMGAIQRMMANHMACKNVALDFSLKPEKRRLFPGIEPDALPGTDETRIRAAIVHLHGYLLGRFDSADSPEVDRTYGLFAGIIADAEARGGFEKVEMYGCGATQEDRFPDPFFTVRAWRGVVTYLLRQHEFLYE